MSQNHALGALKKVIQEQDRQMNLLRTKISRLRKEIRFAELKRLRREMG